MVRGHASAHRAFLLRFGVMSVSTPGRSRGARRRVRHRTSSARTLTAGVALALGLAVPAQSPSAGAAPAKPAGTTEPKSPAAERATFRLPPGFTVDLVAAEPLVEEPVMCTWDADGRLFVVEMRTYMQDIDGTASDAPVSRISVLHDDDGDGRMDRRTTFADGLVLPRMVLPVAGGLLVVETWDTSLRLHRDRDGDGSADAVETVWQGAPDRRNLEHQDSALAR